MKKKINLSIVGIWLAALVNGFGQPAVIQFSATNYLVNEGGTAIITVEITWGECACAYMVDYATSDGTATAGLDYGTQSGTLRFEYPETNKSFTILTLQDC